MVQQPIQARPPHPPVSSAYDLPDGVIPGLAGGGGRPAWLIPVVVGLAALLVVGGLAIVFAR